jgi:hypothetical protein
MKGTDQNKLSRKSGDRPLTRCPSPRHARRAAGLRGDNRPDIAQPVELLPMLRWLQRLVVLSLLPSAGRYMVGFAHCRDCVQYHDAFFHHLEFY